MRSRHGAGIHPLWRCGRTHGWGGAPVQAWNWWNRWNGRNYLLTTELSGSFSKRFLCLVLLELLELIESKTY
jgi:hypothetical protein